MTNETKTITVKTTAWLSITGIVAAIFSWWVNHSIIWAIVHWFFGIFYVVYAALVHTEVIENALREMLG